MCHICVCECICVCIWVCLCGRLQWDKAFSCDQCVCVRIGVVPSQSADLAHHHCLLLINSRLSDKMVLEDDRTGTGRGIPHISGSFNSKLVARLDRAPGDIMGFLEACAMGNQERVEELLEKGVVSAVKIQRVLKSERKKCKFMRLVNILILVLLVIIPTNCKAMCHLPRMQKNKGS